MKGNVCIVSALAAGASVTASALGIGDGLHGFTVKSVADLPEVHGRLVRMVYEKTGTELAWLDRDDENMTFGISFRTLPEDDTGVAHIMEHSVLCGSGKYPVKEPFVDLLKSSLQTFLNAYTSKDQTVYPVSSRNRIDFANLASVYLDAVFDPLSVRTPEAFRQEGWHWEKVNDKVPVRNGVVYNEMKGVYANPESVAFRELCRVLYPDTVYHHDSGGKPSAIPNLTFEQYQAFYRRHYHPTNARVFLDGRVDLDATLAMLDGYFVRYDRVDPGAPIPAQKPVSAEKTVRFALGKDEQTANRTMLVEGWTFGDFSDCLSALQMQVLMDVIVGSNESPLKKAVLERGLAEDVNGMFFSWRQLSACVLAKNVRDGKVDELRAVMRNVLEELANKGLDHVRLAAVLDRKEFNVREHFSGGSATTGVDFMGEALDQWLYGGDPADAFRTKELFANLRAQIPAGGFEKFLRRTLLDNAHRAQVTLVPSETLIAEEAEADRAERERIASGWDAATRKRLAAETAALDAFRAKVDTPEDMAKLPVLPRASIPKRGKDLTWTVDNSSGVHTVRVAAGAQGVYHLRLSFAVDDLSDGELADLPILGCLLGDLATKDHSVLELHNAVDAGLGNLTATPGVYAPDGDERTAVCVFSVVVAGLDSKWGEAVKLVPEILLRTRFDDAKAAGDLVRQRRLELERRAASIAGRVMARHHAAAPFSARGAVEDVFSGLAALRRTQAVDDAFSRDAGGELARLAALAAKVFSRSRLTVYLSDNLSGASAAELVACLPEDPRGAPVVRTPPPRRREGFAIAGETSYAARGGWAGQALPGQARVAARYLSLAYFWDEIRVKGGAYGGGLRLGGSGDIGFLSWRDPQPARSLGVYDGAGAALRRFAAGNETIDRYVVGTIADVDLCMKPSTKVAKAQSLHAIGETWETVQRLRGEVLATEKADFGRIADMLDASVRDASVCVIGGAHSLESCSNLVDRVEAINLK